MNPIPSFSRSCARQHQRVRPSFTQATQSQRRCISTSIPRFYAQPTELPTRTSEAAQELAFTDSQPELYEHNHDGKVNSKIPHDQGHPTPDKLLVGTISRTGTMAQTVQITRQRQVYDYFLKKHYTRPIRVKAHDPNPPNFLREGDVVEYGPYTDAEKDVKQNKDLERIAFMEEKLAKQDKSGKAVRAFKRSEETKARMRGKKARGVQMVVRRVVTPFGVVLDERERLLGEAAQQLERTTQETSAKRKQDVLARTVGTKGSTSRRSARAATTA